MWDFYELYRAQKLDFFFFGKNFFKFWFDILKSFGKIEKKKFFGTLPLDTEKSWPVAINGQFMGTDCTGLYKILLEFIQKWQGPPYFAAKTRQGKQCSKKSYFLENYKF